MKYTGDKPTVSHRGIIFCRGEWTEVNAVVAARLEGNKQFERDEDEAEDLSELKKGDLEIRAGQMGIDIESIEGTGANGNVLKDDLIDAIEAENDA